jgi:short-subunit dehydrogenase involved in D-alanine esterification of teichoic acids
LNSLSAIPDPKTSFIGKNIIVTGGNTGIGLEAAVKFVNSDASKVIITTRDMGKGHAAKASSTPAQATPTSSRFGPST